MQIMPTSCFVLLALTVGSQATISKPPSLAQSSQLLSGSHPLAVHWPSSGRPQSIAMRGQRCGAVSPGLGAAHGLFRAGVGFGRHPLVSGRMEHFSSASRSPFSDLGNVILYIFLTHFVHCSRRREGITKDRNSVLVIESHMQLFRIPVSSDSLPHRAGRDLSRSALT